MKKKNAYIQVNFYKIGKQNYNYYLSRKYLCYSGKRITFKWSLRHFHNFILSYKNV